MPMDNAGKPRSGMQRTNFANKVHGEQSAAPVEQESSNQPIEEVVQQHGPAEKMEIEHNHAAGQHHVTSHHGGHTHKATHGSAAEAHHHAARAAGVNPDEQQQAPPQEPMQQGM